MDHRDAPSGELPEELMDRILDALGGGDGAAADRLAGEHPELGLGPLAAAARQVGAAVPVAISPAARAAHVRRIMQEASALRDAGAPAAAPRPGPARRRPRWTRRLLVGLGALAGLAAVGIPATAALAANAQPGQALYGTKLVVEKAELALQRDPAKRVSLRLTFAEERLSEMQALLAHGTTAHVASVAHKLSSQQSQIQEAVRQLAAGGRPPAPLVRGLELRLAHQASALSSLVTTNCLEPAGRPDCRTLVEAHQATVRTLMRLSELPGGVAPSQMPGSGRQSFAPLVPPVPGSAGREPGTFIGPTAASDLVTGTPSTPHGSPRVVVPPTGGIAPTLTDGHTRPDRPRADH